MQPEQESFSVMDAMDLVMLVDKAASCPQSATTKRMRQGAGGTKKSMLLLILVAGGVCAVRLFQVQTQIPSVLETSTSTSSSSTTTAVNNASPGEERPVLLRREQQHGSWIGNVWIAPPEWKQYSATEMRAFYEGKSIVWIGDSTSRRAALTMYGILNGTAEILHVPSEQIDGANILDVNKKSVTERCSRWTNSSHHSSICRDMPGKNRTGSFVYLNTNCLTDVEQFLHDELSGESNITEGVDIIVVAMGVWEGIKAWECREYTESPRNVHVRQNDTIALLEKFQSKDRAVVWRTSGFKEDNHKTDFLSAMNENAMDQIDRIGSRIWSEQRMVSNLTYVDWGGAVRPRSFGDARISGDIKPHYGIAARVTLVQMITNQLTSIGMYKPAS